MKRNSYFLNTALVAIMTLTVLVAVLVRTLAPAVIIPSLNIPHLVLLSLVALLLDCYLAPDAKRNYIVIPLLGAATFGLLPFVTGFVTVLEALKLALVGGIVFTGTTFLFTSARARLSSGPVAKAAPVLTALCLFLAAQCFTGVVL